MERIRGIMVSRCAMAFLKGPWITASGTRIGYGPWKVLEQGQKKIIWELTKVRFQFEPFPGNRQHRGSKGASQTLSLGGKTCLKRADPIAKSH